jgi:ubiquinone/menaquinone biosynthesis C-methylase UbiE
MSEPTHWYNPYDRLAPFYDWMARVMLVPFGGEPAFRRKVASLLSVSRGERVLELGCGTGAMTRELVSLGADVTAYDLSEAMLARARRRAPRATFVRGDILSVTETESFDRVLLCFVLHEMDEETRARTLGVARRALRPEGRLGILDFAGHAPAHVDRVFRRYLRLAEPEMAWEILDRGLDDELDRASFRVVTRTRLTLGTTEMILARRFADDVDGGGISRRRVD